MAIDKLTKGRIKDLDILSVADKLQLSYSRKGSWRKALCFCHADKTPSLGLCPSKGRWRCFSCGEGGDQISLVMKHENLTYQEACKWLIEAFDIPVEEKEDRQVIIESTKSKLMSYNQDNNKEYLQPELLEMFKGTSNEFTRALVQTGILTPAQMRHAAETFRLSTADDSVIFWQIDSEGNIREGKVMHYQADAHRSHSHKPVTVSWLLKKQKRLDEGWSARPCLFGLHQLQNAPMNSIVAIVESEKTAMICSEFVPTLPEQSEPSKPSEQPELSEQSEPSDGSVQCPVIWLATGGKSNLSVATLTPVKDYQVILFPDTDTTGDTFREWLHIAHEASRQFGHPTTVSDILERNATEDQKNRKIDIADFLNEELRSH